MRKLTHRAFNNVSQIVQLVSTRVGICTLLQFSLSPTVIISHSPIALDMCVPKMYPIDHQDQISLGLLKIKSLLPTSDLLNQNLWVGGCLEFLTNSPGNPVAY